MVRDDGIGFPEGLDIRRTSTLASSSCPPSPTSSAGLSR